MRNTVSNAENVIGSIFCRTKIITHLQKLHEMIYLYIPEIRELRVGTDAIFHNDMILNHMKCPFICFTRYYHNQIDRVNLSHCCHIFRDCASEVVVSSYSVSCSI